MRSAHAAGRQRARSRPQSRRPPSLLRDAKQPVILAGRVSRTPRGLERTRQARRAAQCARRHRPQSRRRLPDRSSAACRRARLPIAAAPEALDGACGRPTSSSASTGSTSPARSSRPAPSAAKIVQVSLDHHLHNGWSMDYQALPPVDVLHRRDARRRGAGAARRRSAPASRARCRQQTARGVQAGRRQAHRRSSGGRPAPRRRRTRRQRSPTSRCPGTAPAGRSAIRSTISAATAAAASAAAPAFRSAPRWR